MHVVALKRIVQTGPFVGTKDKVVEVPNDIGQSWVDAKVARVATEAEVKAIAATGKAK